MKSPMKQLSTIVNSMNTIVFTPSDFVAVLNQTLEFAYPLVTIEGELTNIRVSRNQWVYFDIKDDEASVKCFGSVHVLPGPIENGMMARIVATPRLHALYNFSLNLQSVVPIGEGSLKRAADLLFKKLSKEGLFDDTRKRRMPFAPERVGLITSGESAAYSDFVKILNERWCGISVVHIDVQVQGERAVADIVRAIERMNQLSEPLEVIVITRGGGSADDLATFNTEQIVRAVAGSRVPTLVAIGHEVDVSLAELAADQRASTPSNAVHMLVPDKQSIRAELQLSRTQMSNTIKAYIKTQLDYLRGVTPQLGELLRGSLIKAEGTLGQKSLLLEAMNPESALKRGYAVVRMRGNVLKSVKSLQSGDAIVIQMQDGLAHATVNEVE